MTIYIIYDNSVPYFSNIITYVLGYTQTTELTLIDLCNLYSRLL